MEKEENLNAKKVDNKKDKKKNKPAKAEKKVYKDGLGQIKDPTKSVFGKVLIWILAFLMFGGTLISLIFLLIQVING